MLQQLRVDKFRVLVILALLPLVLSGCFRQASEPFEEAPLNPTANIVEPPPTEVEAQGAGESDAEANETSGAEPFPTLLTITNTPVIEQLPTMPSQDSSAGGTTGSETPEPLATVPILAATNTRSILTPQPPSGPVIFSTPTPFGGAVQTPGQVDAGLITPTSLFADTGGEECTYIVQSGDSLYQIAINNGTTVDELLAANPTVTSTLIQPGDELQLPGCGAPAATPQPQVSNATPTVSGAPGGQRTHVVRAGDTLFAIAREYGVTVQAIVEANDLSNPDRLDLGQELVIP
jgi:N-acetylmuramoyl-L-alanine amidase